MQNENTTEDNQYLGRQKGRSREEAIVRRGDYQYHIQSASEPQGNNQSNGQGLPKQTQETSSIKEARI